MSVHESCVNLVPKNASFLIFEPYVSVKGTLQQYFDSSYTTASLPHSKSQVSFPSHSQALATATHLQNKMEGVASNKGKWGWSPGGQVYLDPSRHI